MPPIKDLISATVIGDLSTTTSPFFRPCRPKVLVVADGNLNYDSAAGFGLTRFLEALAGASPAPIVTVAHRGSPDPASFSIGGVTYNVLLNYKFDTGPTAVAIGTYDQLWLFGFDTGTLPDPEVKRIADFMNAGGGVFATGDHATLGKAMGGRLPRIRHMREWASVPMGNEGTPAARNRIDTVVNPGANALYEFDDQADSIPQRVYPNYDVTWSGGSWTATIHPLLRMPGTPGSRTDATGFTNDMDVMPDHPHESICLEVSTAANPGALNGTYNLAGSNFQEFPNAIAGGGRVGSQIVAYAVSGGRAVLRGVWKPPVNPRMFGIISAFDGHKASPYVAGGARPGRAVCDSTWHHFVNVNLDGTTSGRTGLGTGSGAGFVPSADLQKIYIYYRNVLAWIQPLNRRTCNILSTLTALRFNHALVEELAFADTFKAPEEFEGLGFEAIRIVEEAHGQGAAAEMVQAVLRQEGSAAALAEIRNDGTPSVMDAEGQRLIAYALGRTLAQFAAAVPADDAGQLEAFFKQQSHERLESSLATTLARGVVEAVEVEAGRLERRVRSLQAVKTGKSGSGRPPRPTQPVPTITVG
jgi:hypothetical protein